MMNEQALEDLLAFIEARNITRAALRRNISQPAYSRRLQAIEAEQGVALVDRSQRPARPSPALESRREEIEAALAGLRRLKRSFAQDETIGAELVIAAVHAVASGPLPAALARVETAIGARRVLLRAADQAECFRMLMTEEASLMLVYETAAHPLQGPPDLTSKSVVASDLLAPVCAPEMAVALQRGRPGLQRLPLIGYPRQAFLGQVLFDEIMPLTPHRFSDRISAALTTAVAAFAREGLGVAWAPLSLIREPLARGTLTRLDGALFPSIELKIVALQLKTKSAQKLAPIWATLSNAMRAG